MSMELFDYNHDIRAIIEEDGTVKNSAGDVVGYIEPNGTAIDTDNVFIGEINDDGQVIDSEDDVIGRVELDHGTLRDRGGSHWATIYSGGDINDTLESYRGRVSNFSFHQLRYVASFLFFFDPSFVQDGRESRMSQGISSNSAPTVESVPEARDSASDPWAAAAAEPSYGDWGNPPSAPESVEVTLPTVTLSLPTPASAPKPPEPLKPYRVGDFLAIEGGTKNKLSIADCDCDTERLSIRVESNGYNVVFARDDKTQRFALPYQVLPGNLEALYQRNEDGGLLTLTITKPTSGSGNNSGQFFSLVVPGKGVEEGKVNMSAGQTSEYFLFKPQGTSSYDTELVGELVSGRDVLFHATVTQTDKGTRTKSTQTFTLPIQIDLSHIKIENENEVKVFMKSSASAPTITVPDASVAITAL